MKKYLYGLLVLVLICVGAALVATLVSPDKVAKLVEDASYAISGPFSNSADNMNYFVLLGLIAVILLGLFVFLFIRMLSRVKVAKPIPEEPLHTSSDKVTIPQQTRNQRKPLLKNRKILFTIAVVLFAGIFLSQKYLIGDKIIGNWRDSSGHSYAFKMNGEVIESVQTRDLGVGSWEFVSSQDGKRLYEVHLGNTARYFMWNSNSSNALKEGHLTDGRLELNGFNAYTSFVRSDSEKSISSSVSSLTPVGVYSGDAPMGPTKYTLSSDGSYKCVVNGVRTDVSRGTWRASGSTITFNNQGVTYSMELTSKGLSKGGFTFERQ